MLVGAKRSGRVAVLACGAAIVAGCYVYTPAPVTPAAGTHLLLELTDRGRVGLGDSVGPAAVTIEGTAMSSSDSAYSIRVLKVGYLNGQSNNWTGEPLLVERSFISTAKEQKFSRGRTWFTAAAVTAATIAFVASRGLLGFGSSSSDSGGGRPKTN